MSLNRRRGCPGCGAWGAEPPKREFCAYCKLIEPIAEVFGLGVVRVVVFTDHANRNRTVRNMARLRGVSPKDLVNAIEAMCDLHDVTKKRHEILRRSW